MTGGHKPLKVAGIYSAFQDEMSGLPDSRPRFAFQAIKRDPGAVVTAALSGIAQARRNAGNTDQ